MAYGYDGGDQCALDIWANYSQSTSLRNYSFKLISNTKLTVDTIWIHGNNPVSKSPLSVNAQLYTDGNTDDKGEELTLSASNDADKNWKHTWASLDPDKKYTIEESTVKGYKQSGGEIKGNAADGYTATFVNTYIEPDDPDNPDKPQDKTDPQEPAGTQKNDPSADTSDSSDIFNVFIMLILVSACAVITISLKKE